MHTIITPNNEKLDEQYLEFKTGYADIFPELVLLAMADTLGSQLSENNHIEFEFRVNFYKNVFNNF